VEGRLAAILAGDVGADPGVELITDAEADQRRRIEVRVNALEAVVADATQDRLFARHE
jgi:hypothetical protein